MGMCDPKIEYPINLDYKITEKDGKQYLTGKSTFKVDFGKDSDVSNSKRSMQSLHYNFFPTVQRHNLPEKK